MPQIIALIKVRLRYEYGFDVKKYDFVTLLTDEQDKLRPDFMIETQI